MTRRRLVVICGAAVVGAVLLVYALQARRARGLQSTATPWTGQLTFDGESSDLTRTRIAATLDTPIKKGENVIWCVSFQAAWKKLQDDLAGGPVRLEGAGEIAEALNRARDRGDAVPEGCLYTAVGWEDKGILDRIRTDVARMFPNSTSPTFPDIMQGSFVAYSHLEAGVQFDIPYFQNDEPLTFTASDGTTIKVASFGLRPKDDYAYYELRKQPRVLFTNDWELAAEPVTPECVIDLDAGSHPSQVIVAMVEPQATLGATVALVEEKIAQSRRGASGGIGANDVLLVPDVVWRITHHFAELEGRSFQNPPLQGQRMDVAQQDIQFRLDRSGAELQSEAKQYCAPIPMHYVFDHPFLILMQKRGETRPYFVMWVDNAELLRPMESAQPTSR